MEAKAGLGKVALFLICFLLAVSSCNNDEVTPDNGFTTDDTENILSDAMEAAGADDAAS